MFFGPTFLIFKISSIQMKKNWNSNLNHFLQRFFHTFPTLMNFILFVLVLIPSLTHSSVRIMLFLKLGKGGKIILWLNSYKISLNGFPIAAVCPPTILSKTEGIPQVSWRASRERAGWSPNLEKCQKWYSCIHIHM